MPDTKVVETPREACAEPLSKPERNAHEFWSGPPEDIELVADPHDVDTSSSASRQHYIDTGNYLDAGEAVTHG